MQFSAIHKEKDGKMVRIDLDLAELDGKRFIKDIKISGDFFLTPEDMIWEIEDLLKNTILDEKIIFLKINTLIKHNKGQLIGISVSNLANIIANPK